MPPPASICFGFRFGHSTTDDAQLGGFIIAQMKNLFGKAASGRGWQMLRITASHIAAAAVLLERCGASSAPGPDPSGRLCLRRSSRQCLDERRDGQRPESRGGRAFRSAKIRESRRPDFHVETKVSLMFRANTVDRRAHAIV